MDESRKRKISERLKGQHHSIKTRFQKGYIPHNKGKKFVGGHYFGRPI